MSAADFALQIDREWLEKQGDIKDALVKLSLDAIRKIDMRSPVDTGRFRANWTMSIGGISATITEQVDPTGGATVARNMAVAETYPIDSFPMIYLQNNLPYAERLENGYSAQAPGGMVGISLVELAATWEATTL